MKKKDLIILTVVCASLAIAYPFVHQPEKKSLDDLFGDMPSTTATAAVKPLSDPLPAVSSTSVSSSPGTALQVVSTTHRNIKSISRTVAIEQFNKTNYYESIVSEVEGFRATMYHDNIGGAIGNGWNVSAQNKGMNTAITKEIAMPQNDANALISLSGNLKPSSFPNVSITPEQATKAAQVMRIKAFDPVVIKALGKDVWDKLTPNQQAVVVYHAYKTGNLNWKNLKASIIKCANTQDKNDCASAGSQFTYSYMLNGTRMFDKRSNLYMNALFQNPSDYGYLLGLNNASPDFQSIAKPSELKIDTAKKADEQIEEQDTYTKEKDRLIDLGQPFNIQLVTPELVAETPAKTTVKRNVNASYPTGSFF